MQLLGKKVRRPAAKEGWQRGRDVDPHRAYQQPPDKDSPPPPISIEAIIDRTLTACVKDGERAYLSPPREQGKRAKHVVHPSSVYGCPRALQFALLDVKEQSQERSSLPRSRLERIFDNGHGVHQRLQGYLFEAQRRGIGGVGRVWEDVKLRHDPLLIAGELDQIIQVKGRRYVIEYKSSNSKEFAKLDALNPKSTWLWQVYCYMQAVGLRAAIIVVECKDDQRLKEYYASWDDKIWDTISVYIMRVMVAVQKKEQADAMTLHCHWCNYKYVCDAKGGDSGLIPWTNLKRIDFARTKI